MNISLLFSSHRGASLLLSLFLAVSASAQRSLDLAGSWTMADGKKANLPGSMLTNDLGDEVTIDTKWTGSLYDSSFYYNPYMALIVIPTKLLHKCVSTKLPKFPFVKDWYAAMKHELLQYIFLHITICQLT